MALVVYVFATVLMLAAGLKETLVTTGQPDNVVVIRRSAQTEVQSGVDRSQAGIVESLPDIAIGADGTPADVEGAGRAHQPAKARDWQTLERDDTRRDAAKARAAAAGRLVEGRMFRPGTSEVVTGRSIANGFRGAAIGETRALRFARLDGRRRVRRGPHRVQIPRSGATPSRCCRRSGAPAIRRCCSG